jgi:7-carboxy-7-deazaguanine synthase
MLKINEIFYDIEGEGKHQGYPTLFIRLTGCNLRCVWCDTKYAYNKGKNREIKGLLKVVKRSPFRFINITGGEPLQQRREVIGFIRAIRRVRPDITVSVETNGASNIKNVPADNISMDIKLPSSGEHKKMLLSNLSALKPKDQLKLVIGSTGDLEYAKRVLAKHKVKAPIFAQPVFGKFKLSKIQKFVMKNRLNWKCSIQLHKIAEKF